MIDYKIKLYITSVRSKTYFKYSSFMPRVLYNTMLYCSNSRETEELYLIYFCLNLNK